MTFIYFLQYQSRIFFPSFGTKTRENSCFDVLHFVCIKNLYFFYSYYANLVLLFFNQSPIFRKCSFLIGYILQQCALANNIQHFKMVMESVSYKEEDLMYTDPETGIFVIDRHSYRYMYR